jgi:hypothetical protein
MKLLKQFHIEIGPMDGPRRCGGESRVKIALFARLTIVVAGRPIDRFNMPTNLPER